MDDRQRRHERIRQEGTKNDNNEVNNRTPVDTGRNADMDYSKHTSKSILETNFRLQGRTKASKREAGAGAGSGQAYSKHAKVIFHKVSSA